VLFSFGYLIHDVIDLIYHERTLRTFELLFHHVSIAVALLCCVLTKRFVAVAACGLLMEVTGFKIN
jgi:hypothetical protein